MTSIHLTATGARLQAEVRGPLTAGMVGIPVTITYDGIWEGLTKTLVCRGGGMLRDVIGIDTQATVAPEVLCTGDNLYLGIEGRNSDGTLVIPTTWAYCGPVQEGASASGDESTTADMPIWVQLQQQIGFMDWLDTENKSSLVSAINELYAMITALTVTTE